MSIEQVENNQAKEVQQVPETEIKKVDEVENSTSAQSEKKTSEIPDYFVNIDVEINLPHEPFKIHLPLGLFESVADIQYAINETPKSVYYTCFHLEHNGVKLNEYEELNTIEGLKENPVLTLVNADYNERESRFHIARLRDFLAGPYQFNGRYGYGEATSAFSSVITPKVPAKKNKSKKKNSNKPEALNEAMVLRQFEDYSFDEAGKDLLYYVPEDKSPLVPKALKQLILSGWNLVSPIRKLDGDLLYLSVTTLEGKTYEITSHVSGYFVNNSTSEVFNPSRKEPVHNNKAHSLFHLLQYLSPLFRNAMTKIQKIYAETDVLTYFKPVLPFATYPWMVSNPIQTYDAARPSDGFLREGNFTYADCRDWNEEKQTNREMPSATLPDKALRDKLYLKFYSEFLDAGAQVTTLVAEGNLKPLNPNEPPETWMYVHNNIFVSKAYDGVGHFDIYGGEEASYVATSKDINGVRVINSLDIPDIYTLESTLIDYMGNRYSVQCVIPGLFKNEELIILGTSNNGETVLHDEKLDQLTATIGEKLQLTPHKVLDKEGKEFTINTSLDVKGLIGAEGRKYFVDLHRLNPVDIQFQEKHCKELEGFAAYPHKITLLRRELVEAFVAHKKTEIYNKNNSVNGETTEKSEEKKEVAPLTQEQLSEIEFSLNPDVFTEIKLSREGENEALVKRDENRVREASAYISDVLIPELAKHIAESKTLLVDTSTVTANLHSRGINMRYLGALYTEVSKHEFPAKQHALQLLSTEMVFRSCKFILRRLLRNIPVQAVAQCVAHFFNCLLHPTANISSDITDSSKDYAYLKLTPESLKTKVLETVATRFRFTMDSLALVGQAKVNILRNLCIVIGIQLLARDYKLTGKNTPDHSTQPELTNGNSNHDDELFKPTDIVAMVPRVKHTFPELKYPEECLYQARKAFESDSKLGFEKLNETISIYEQVYGPIHPETAYIYTCAAHIYLASTDPQYGIEYYRKSVIAYERALGLDHPTTLQTYVQYAIVLSQDDKIEESFRIFRYVMEQWHSLYPPLYAEMAHIDHSVGCILQSFQQFQLGFKFIERALNTITSILSPNSEGLHEYISSYARAHLSLGDFKQAIKYEKEAYNSLVATKGLEDPLTKRSSLMLESITRRAVDQARETENMKNPKIRELAQQMEKLKQVYIAKEEQKEISSKGHLPVEDLVKFINGPSSVKRPNGTKHKPKKAVSPKPSSQ